MRYIVSILVLIVSLSSTAQLQYHSLFEVDANHRKSGYLIGMGTTKLFAQSNYELEFLAIPEAIDAGTYLGSFDPKGRFGFHIEGGMFWITERSFFDFVDVNLGYSQHRGDELYTAVKQAGALDSLPELLAGTGTFAQDILSLNVNLNKAVPIKGYWYGLGAIGADFSYRLINNHEYDFQHPSLVSEPASSSINLNAHAKLGIGYKTSSSSWLSLTAETPIEAFIPFNGLTSRKEVFNSKYRPVTFTLRYQWLRKRPSRECPTGPKKIKEKKKRKKSGRGGMRDGQLG